MDWRKSLLAFLFLSRMASSLMDLSERLRTRWQPSFTRTLRIPCLINHPLHVLQGREKILQKHPNGGAESQGRTDTTHSVDVVL